MSKKRVIKKYEQLSDEVMALLKSKYPDGYEENLITFQTPTGGFEMGLPLETDDAYYLIKMPKRSLPQEDDDDDDADTSGDSLESLDSLQIADDAMEDDD